MKTHVKVLFSKTGIYKVKVVYHDDGHSVSTYRELYLNKIYKGIRRFLLLKFSKTERFKKMKEDVYHYVREECGNSWHPTYMKYFDEWFNNCSDYQIKCFSVWMKGKMGPFDF